MCKALIVVIALALLLGAFVIYDVPSYLSLSALQSAMGQFHAWYDRHPLVTIAIFSLFCLGVTTLSLPGGTLMTLAAGALFGFWLGATIIVLAGTLGSTLAFLAARHFMRDHVMNKYGSRMQVINDGVEKEGGFYLFFMRLVPVFPYIVVNLMMGLTKIRGWTYIWVSLVGMLPSTIVFAYTGTALARVREMDDIVTIELLLALTLLGLLPLASRKLLTYIHKFRQRAHA